jgi:hypothetical protein
LAIADHLGLGVPGGVDVGLGHGEEVVGAEVTGRSGFSAWRIGVPCGLS